jgi:hypothetical protein
MLYLLEQIEYKDWKVTLSNPEGGLIYLQWHFLAPDWTHITQPIKNWSSRKWYLSQHMTESELVQTAFAAALQAEEHEAREAFAYRRQRIFNPHISVNALMQVCHQLEVRQ